MNEPMGLKRDRKFEEKVIMARSEAVEDLIWKFSRNCAVKRQLCRFL